MRANNEEIESLGRYINSLLEAMGTALRGKKDEDLSKDLRDALGELSS